MSGMCAEGGGLVRYVPHRHPGAVLDASSGGQERSVLILHPHWKVLLWPVIFGVLVVVATMVVLTAIPGGHSHTERLITAAVAVVLLLVWVLRPVLRWKTTTYELISGRLRLREGILTRTATSPAGRISDVSFHRSLLDRLSRLRRPPRRRADGRSLLALPSVERVQAILFELVEAPAPRRRRSLGIILGRTVEL